MSKILVCGDRHWTDQRAVYSALVDEVMLLGAGETLVVIEGEAPGADTEGRIAAQHLGLEVIAVPADWKKYGRAAGPIRNIAMLDLKPDKVLAFHSNLWNSKGTRHCVEQAEKRGIPVRVITNIP